MRRDIEGPLFSFTNFHLNFLLSALPHLSLNTVMGIHKSHACSSHFVQRCSFK